MKFSSFYILLVLLTACDCLQLAEGIVVHSETGKPVQNAKILNKAKPQQFEYTDSKGVFRLTSVSGGLFRCPPMHVEISKDSFITQEFIMNYKDTGALKLKPEPIKYDDGACIPTLDSLDGMLVTAFPNKQAEFIGGDAALMKFIANQFEHSLEMELNLETKALCSFVIDTFGAVRNACIYKSSTKGVLNTFELEALRVINSMPAWKVGELGGRKVPVRVKLPIRFCLR